MELLSGGVMSQSPSGVTATMSYVKRQPKGRSKRRPVRPRHGFTPSEEQLHDAKHLIIRVLKHGKLYACNLKDAVHELLRRFGSSAHRLGKTIEEKATTVTRGLLDLTKAARIAFNGNAFRLI